ncbi:type VI secretion system lipoprotein TssJ [Caballeronia sp. EK]|nr:type VI secretion system lipoprotein TssJ [Caballeronia sp. EK]
MLNPQTAAAMFITLSLSGCGVWQAASDSTVNAYDTVFHNRGKTVDIDLTAHADLNRDDAGHAKSVAVRVYQLKDRKRFDDASYNDLLNNDDTLLAQDVQARTAVVVNPGGSASTSQPMERETKFVAIAAFYQNVGKAGAWRLIVPTKKLPDDAPLKLTLSDRTLDISNDNAKPARK